MDGDPRLFWVRPDVAGDARGLFWPEPDNNPDRSELVAFEADLHPWLGDDLLLALPPWHLMSDRLLALVEEAELSGLRVGAEADVGPVDPSFGALGARRFKIVVPEKAIRVRVPGKASSDGMSIDDQPVFDEWDGSDFSRPRHWDDGMLVTDRTMKVLRRVSIARCSIREVLPDGPTIT